MFVLLPQGPSEADGEGDPEEPSLARTLDVQALEQLWPFCQATGLVLMVNALFRFPVVEPGEGVDPNRGIVSAALGAVLLGVGTATRFWSLPAWVGHPIGLLLIGILVGTGYYHASLGVDPGFPAYFVMLILGLAYLMPARGWFLASLFLTYGAWEVIVWAHPEAGPWTRTRMAVLAAVLTSGFLHEARFRLMRSFHESERLSRSLQGQLASAQSLLEAREDQLVETRARVATADRGFQAVCDAFEGMIWLTDGEGRIESSSAAWSELTGSSATESAGHGWISWIHAEDLETCRSAVRAASNQGQSHEFEVRCRGRAKGYQRFRCRLEPVRSRGGEIDRLIWIFQAAKDAAPPDQLTPLDFLRMTEKTPHVVYIFDCIEKRTLYVNPWIEQVLGYTPEQICEMGAQVLTRLIHPDDLAARPTSAVYDGLRDEQVLHFESRARRADGHYRVLQCQELVLDRLSDGRAWRIQGHVYDVTEPRRTEEALRRRDRRKEEFLGTLAHELRNPLAAIVNACEVISTPELADQHAWACQMVDRQARSLGRLADDLMDVSRVSRGMLSLSKQTLDLRELVRGSIETMLPLAEDEELDLSWQVPTTPLWVDGDPARLEQVLVNLLGNAIRYTESGGQIQVIVEDALGERVVRVRDTGLGIEADDLPKLFDLFAKVELVRSRSRGGLGVGLTLVKMLTELHGGSVTASSDGPDRGSEFVVRLPAASPPLEPKRVPAMEEPARSARILLVDDNVAMTRALGELLRHCGHEVRICSDGMTAVSIVLEFRPDLILLDLHLPDIDGFEVATRIRAFDELRATPLVSVSGFGQEMDRERSRACGFVTHLVKPVRHSDITGLVESLCQPKELAREPESDRS